jgi:nitrite reductase/ring-hydroxylating ferredoxin subunit
MPFVYIGPVSALPPGSVMEARIDGRPIAVCNSGGTVYALDGTCPHAGGPLGHGALHGTMLVCPFHGWEFDCRSGENDSDPAIAVETYAAKIEGGDILVDLYQRAGTT